MYAAILAGGVGTRLWPRSRQAQPKQFSDITGSGRTMIQATADRLAGLVTDADLFIVTGRAYAGLSADQLSAMPGEQVLVEPSGRNTAPAIGLAAIHVARRDPKGVLAILPADHVILDTTAFQAALALAGRVAEEGAIVTLGIEPAFAHTGYGYIQRAEQIAAPGDSPVYRVERFLEKPQKAVAEQFLADGGYYWNGGIFVARVDVWLGEIERQMPEMYARLVRIGDALGTPMATAVLNDEWPHMPNTSIDYGIMEQAERVAVVPLSAGWNDVGSWDALEAILQSDNSGNRVARDNALLFNSSGNIVYTDKPVVALIDVHDLVIVDTGDALLVGNKSQMQRVKDVVEALRQLGRSELL